MCPFWLLAQDRAMTDPCARDPGRIDALRDWAWERGRTDIVLDLDLHASAWAFQNNPTQPHLARLAALLPRDHADGGLAATLRQAAVTGCQAGDLDCLQQALHAWCPQLCTRVLADLQEMATDPTRAAALSAPPPVEPKAAGAALQGGIVFRMMRG
jgi:hypothetical protein